MLQGAVSVRLVRGGATRCAFFRDPLGKKVSEPSSFDFVSVPAERKNKSPGTLRAVGPSRFWSSESPRDGGTCVGRDRSRASPCAPNTPYLTAMLDKIDAPPPQMVTCDYCAKMIDKRELKHHQVGVRARRVHSPIRRSTQARPVRARGQARSGVGERASRGARERGRGGQRRMRARPCTHAHTHTRTHDRHTQAFDCLQSELRIMQCPKGCGQNIEVPFMALVRLQRALGTVVCMPGQTPAFRRAGAQSRQARSRRMSYGAGAL